MTRLFIELPLALPGSANYYTTSAAGPPQVCNLNDFSRATCFFCLAGLVGGSPIRNLTPIFFVNKSFFLKHHGDLSSTGKGFVKSKGITVNFSKNKKFNLKVS